MEKNFFPFTFNNKYVTDSEPVCCIIAAGEMSEADISALADMPFEHAKDIIVAADGGAVYAARAGIVPNVIIGDFDSALPSGRYEYLYDSIGQNEFDSAIAKFCEKSEIIRYPIEKDDTDLMLAIKLGISRGFKLFCIFGALGGAFYHNMASVQSFKYIAERGGIVCAVGKANTLICIGSGEAVFSEDFLPDAAVSPYLKHRSKTPGSGKFSLFSLSEKSFGVCIKNAKYELQDENISSSFPIGAGNSRIAGKRMSISVKDGIILIDNEF